MALVTPELGLVPEDILVISNTAAVSPDNGNRNIKAMGYILVQ